MDDIKKYGGNIEKLEVLILRNLELKNLKAALEQFEKVDAKTQEKITSWIN
jgi:hypothetical protein